MRDCLIKVASCKRSVAVCLDLSSPALRPGTIQRITTAVSQPDPQAGKQQGGTVGTMMSVTLLANLISAGSV